MIRPLPLAILSLALLLPIAPDAQAVVLGGVSADQDGVTLDRDKVRYGDASTFDAKKAQKVGTVRSTEVYEAIPAYKTIKKESVQEGTARWQQLMKEATEAYKAALRKVAADNSFVLIVEEGGISGYEHASDCTSSVIASI